VDKVVNHYVLKFAA